MKRDIFILSIVLFCLSINLNNKATIFGKTTIFNEDKDGLNLMLTDYYSSRFDSIMHVNNSLDANQFIKSCGVRPVRVIINNNTEKSISVSSKSINLPIIDNKKISTKLSIGSPILETVLFSLLAAMYLVPMGIGEGIIRYDERINSVKDLIKLCSISLTCSVFTFMGLGYYFYKANMRHNQLEYAIRDIALDNKIIINPGESINKILFIDINCWQPLFDFRVYNENGSAIIETFKVKFT